MSFEISLDNTGADNSGVSNTGADNSGVSNTSSSDIGSKSSCSSEVIATKLISSNRVVDLVFKGTLNVIMISIRKKNLAWYNILMPYKQIPIKNVKV